MDNIKFVIEDMHDLPGVTFKDYDVAVYLNDIKMPHTIFNASEVLPAANYRHVEFDLFTCSCGAAGCAGFQSPVVQTIKNGVATWVFPEGNDYISEKKVYDFDENQLKETFNALTKEMLQMEADNMIHTTMVRDNSYYGDEEDENPRYEAKDKLIDSIQWFDQRYHGQQDFNDMLEKTYPQYVNKKLQYTYKDVAGLYEYKYSLGEIICRVLNDYPRKAKDASYLKKCKKAALAVIAFMNGEKEALKQIAHTSYEDNDMHSNSVIHWDFPQVSEEDFNFDHVELMMVQE